MAGEHICDDVDKVRPLIEAEDWGRLIAISLRSGDDECRCTRPLLTGLDLMCACCLHRNRSQIARREAAMAAPHQFEVEEPGDALDRIGMCRFCSMWRDDERHQVAAEEPAP